MATRASVLWSAGVFPAGSLCTPLSGEQRGRARASPHLPGRLGGRIGSATSEPSLTQPARQTPPRGTEDPQVEFPRGHSTTHQSPSLHFPCPHVYMVSLCTYISLHMCYTDLCVSVCTHVKAHYIFTHVPVHIRVSVHCRHTQVSECTQPILP